MQYNLIENERNLLNALISPRFLHCAEFDNKVNRITRTSTAGECGPKLNVTVISIHGVEPHRKFYYKNLVVTFLCTPDWN